MCQTACKPGSVRAAPTASVSGNPPRRSGTTIPLGRALRRASRDQPGRRGGNASAATGRSGASSHAAGRPYSVLLPVGFAVPPLLPGARCALTAPFHPCPPTFGWRPPGRPDGPTLSVRAVCFLWHCPWGRPRRRLAGTVFPWSPDFPLPTGRTRQAAAVQPSGGGDMDAGRPGVKRPGVKRSGVKRSGVKRSGVKRYRGGCGWAGAKRPGQRGSSRRIAWVWGLPSLPHPVPWTGSRSLALGKARDETSPCFPRLGGRVPRRPLQAWACLL